MLRNSTPISTLDDPDIQRRINDLRETNNIRGWFYLAREYLFLAAVVGCAIWFYFFTMANGISLWWLVPVAVVAIILVGAGQHRLAGLTHEAAHYMLFRTRLLNDIISEWFCMFPVLGVTHKYRIQHLGHHQYPNDPDRDPDFVQLERSGHRFQFPMTKWQFLWHCVIKQFLLLYLPFRYIRVRARFDGTSDKPGPYSIKGKKPKCLTITTAIYLTVVAALSAWFVYADHPLRLACVPAVLWACVFLFYLRAPQRFFTHYVIKSALPPRAQACMHVTYYSLVIAALAWLTLSTGHPWYVFYFVLWLVPLATSFAYFMILRQIVQHGNGSQDRLTNTRIFHVAWPISMAVFPYGNDYHLPHHMFPMVPYHNLRKLHALLMQTKEYQSDATVVEGYFLPRKTPRTHPTVVDLMTQPNRAASSNEIPV